MSLPKKTTVNVIPTLRYDDATAAVDWLCRAFGFQRRLIVPGERNGTIAHAELVYGNGMIMLGSADTHGGGYDELVTTPRQVGGRETQTAYVIVEDPDAHHARAVAAGAVVVMPLEDKGFGGRGYTCRDLEGHVWNFGSYDPYAG
jgi:uncharacterized glyoxalase superfamily protein PhnB